MNLKMFGDMLNQPKKMTTVEVNATVEEFLDKLMIQEIEMGIKMLKNEKSCGIDEILPECLKKE